jgi:hypothetical protein
LIFSVSNTPFSSDVILNSDMYMSIESKGVCPSICHS